MPPQLQQLLQNRRLLAIIGIALAILVVVVLVIAMSGGEKQDSGARKLNENEKNLATVENIGKAIEIQALLAREKISLIREDVEGGKAKLKFQDSATTDDRDRALVSLVQSGLMDKNVGLEIFEKGDLTASREEKRIKLVRARNGELVRLIRKIDPIQDASVFISMPEPTIFKRDMMPISATVQVVLSPGERLTRDKIRSIINLLVGSIENLDAKHVSLTDTNGNVYNSVLDPTDEMTDKLEERDRYMEQKIKTQLDRLLGQNKYVVTVATYLREAPRSELSLDYDPQRSSVAKSAEFQENLNAQQRGTGLAGGPVSSYVPDEVESGFNGSEQSQRGYNRNGQELEYNAGKKQITEDLIPGMMEEITIAVTVDSNAFPANLTMDEFKTLVARAASPMVNPENVTIATGKSEELTPITPTLEPEFEIPWWAWVIAAILLLILLVLLLRILAKPSVDPRQLYQQQMEIQQLKELATNQAHQLENTQQQAHQMLQAHQQQLAQLAAQREPGTPRQQEDARELKQTLSELQGVLIKAEDVDLDEEELGTEIKSWIEST